MGILLKSDFIVKIKDRSGDLSSGYKVDFSKCWDDLKMESQVVDTCNSVERIPCFIAGYI